MQSDHYKRIQNLHMPAGQSPSGKLCLPWLERQQRQVGATDRQSRPAVLLQGL